MATISEIKSAVNASEESERDFFDWIDATGIEGWEDFVRRYDENQHTWELRICFRYHLLTEYEKIAKAAGDSAASAKRSACMALASLIGMLIVSVVSIYVQALR